MDISHLECRALHPLTLRSRKGIFHEKKEFYFEPDVFVWTVGSLEEFGRFWGPLEKFADIGSLDKAIR
jgi:hypothetical protein